MNRMPVLFVIVCTFSVVSCSDSDTFVLSRGTGKVVKNLNVSVKMNVYVSDNIPVEFNYLRHTLYSLLKQVDKIGGNTITIEYINPLTESSIAEAKAMGIKEVDLQSTKPDDGTPTTSFLGIALLCEDRRSAIPVIRHTEDLEYQLVSAILEVTRRKPMKIAIFEPETPEETNKYSLKIFKNQYRDLLETISDEYDLVYVNESTSIQILNNADLCVVINNGSAVSEKSLFLADQYLMNEGRIIFAEEAISLDFLENISAGPKKSALLGMISHYGITIEPSLLLDCRCGQFKVPQKCGPYMMDVPVFYPYFVKVPFNDSTDRKSAFTSSGDVIFPWVSPLRLSVNDPSVYRYDTLASSSEKSWITKKNINLHYQQNWLNQKVYSGNHTIAAMLTGPMTSYFSERKQPENSPDDFKARCDNGLISVIGDVDFVASSSATTANISFFMALLKWMIYDDLRDISILQISDEEKKRYELKK